MPGELIPILILLGLFAMIFGLRYLNNKENMAMIQNGMDPKINRPQPQSQPYKNLKWGLLLMGSGVGLFLAFVLDNFVFDLRNKWGDHRPESVFMYFSLLAIFGGLGLIVSFAMEKKTLDTK
ncbi:hypothetical protein GS399_01495 [Pedobacter sp. HMF7647]|uniref:DUF6249 domain-containing protein n=1 Tax=Hufsiella arboris TaxID=2695275 RepID=A0A7K1Y5D1_9SPHI|nr:DUF6249 domain-containing protein [Hufsiella arboris]MXV49630.1 hypothetical protein [Hufsiella arboris]